MNRNNLPPLTKKPQPPSQDIPTNKSFYSDQVVASSKFRLKSHGRPDAEMQPSMLWQSNTIKNIPKTHLMSSEPSNLVKKSKLAAIGKTTQDLRVTDFKPESYKPKVQIQNTVPPGQKPRRVKVERDRREFEINKASDLAKLLTSVGVTEKDLLPPAAYNNLYRPKYNEFRNDFTYKRYLNLNIFDNSEFDCRTNQEWLNIGQGGPVPGYALLKDEDGADSTDNSLCCLYSWKKVGVVGYETTSDETIWFVQELDREGRVKINLKTQVKASTWPTENNQHRVNRTSLFFASENPINFAERLKEVVDHRNEVEGLLRKSLYVDCMPTSDVPTTFDLEEIMNRTGSDSVLASGLLSQKAINKIKKQVERTMKIQ